MRILIPGVLIFSLFFSLTAFPEECPDGSCSVSSKKVQNVPKGIVRKVEGAGKPVSPKDDTLTKTREVDKKQEPVKREEPPSGSPSGDILPEMTQAVTVSSVDVNRIVCPKDVRDVVYSKEKGLTVKIMGRSVYVKFPIVKEGDREVTAAQPADLYVVCGDDVYSLILLPKPVPAQTVRLSPGKGETLKKNVLSAAETAHERFIVEIIKAVWKNEIPDEYTVGVLKEEVMVNTDVRAVGKRVIDIEGAGLRIKEYSIEIRNPGIEEMELSERDFIRSDISSRPVAISLEKHMVKRTERPRVFIVERRIEQ